MSDTETDKATEAAAPAPAPAPAPEEEQQVGLDDFCMMHSRVPSGPDVDRGKHSVEMISAFRHVEMQAGRVRDTVKNFVQRLHELAHSNA